jgi:hypothetical protein
VPAWLVTNEGDVYGPFPLTTTVKVAIGVLHVVSPGPKSWKVMMPVGLAPPFRLATAKV